MPSQVTLKALGLNYSPNQLSVPEGSLVEANDVVIRRDNVIESRRGYRDYASSFGLSSDIPKQLIQYKNRLIVHHSNKLSFDTGEVDDDGLAIFDDFFGTYLETQTGLRIKSIEANKNLYFTTSTGIKKISAVTADDFSTASGYVTNSGAVKALDISAELEIEQGQVVGFLPVDSTVAYRVIWGYKDANENLLLGTPSNRVEVYNFLLDVIALDLNALCINLDIIDQSPCLIDDGDYASSFYSPIGTDAFTLQDNVISLAEKIDGDLLFGDDGASAAPLDWDTVEILNNEAILTFGSGDPQDYVVVGDWVTIAGLTTTSPDITVLNGNWEVTSVDATTIKFVIVNADVVSTAIDATGTLNSYNYQRITATGDDTYATPLDTLVIDIPATSEQLRTIENTIFRISERLKIELPDVIPTTLQTAYITPYLTTEVADVQLKIIIPSDITSDYFVQVYRSRVFTAESIQSLGDTGPVPVTPDDEMRLVFEAFPTSAEIAVEEMIVLDNYPDDLVQNNTNLYTNPITGEGTAQANDIPPFAKDINSFKDVTFFANTRTRHRLTPFQLLGVSLISNGDKFTIDDGTTPLTYTFVDGVQEVTDITFTMTGLAAGEYFTIYSANDDKKYLFWYEIDGAGTAPVDADATIIRVSILSTFTDSQLAQRSLDVINEQIYDFEAVVDGALPDITITNINEGYTTDATASTSPFTVTVVTQGVGEDDTTRQILKSSSISAAQAVDLTARSLVRVINKQASSPVYAYYISGANTPPGQINLEDKELSDVPFYVLAANENLGLSFNPDIGPINTDITTISIASPTVITTSSPHGLINGNQIMITNSDSTPIVDGLYTVTVTGTTTFTIPVAVTGAGSQGSWSEVSDLVVSNNEIKPNRIYYSKVSQPEAVPLLNYFPVGAEDKNILRIFPLRDSLFVFKEDGLYRISGQSAPFVTGLFDGSCQLIAPDSVALSNNVIYAWTEQGISNITESGIYEVSRPVDTAILQFASASYPNFSTVTWGVGYDSDNSYTVYTNSSIDDEVATIAFRYSNLTNSFTNFIRTENCGLILQADDKQYLGSGASNLIQQERKSFDRTDYADNDFEITLENASLASSTVLKFPTVDDISVGDVLIQEQNVSLYNFNQLLSKLDLDLTVGLLNIASTSGTSTTITVTTSAAHGLNNGDYVVIADSDSSPSIDGTYQVSSASGSVFDITVSTALTAQATTGTVKRDYVDTYEAIAGDNMRQKLVDLADALDTDPALLFTDYADRIANKSGSITSNDIASPTVINTSVAHELVDGRIVDIAGTQTPQSIPDIEGKFEVSATGTFGVSTTFSIDVDVSTGGGSGLTFDTVANLNSADDLLACFNELVNRLNNDGGATFSNYKLIENTTLFEAVITNVNRPLRQITVNLGLQWIVGAMRIYKAIPCSFTYAPITFGDPLMSKQISDATFMFKNKAFTTITVGFSSDLKPAFNFIEFSSQGNGIFGHYSPPGFGYGFFGGASNAAPFRTIVPRDAQRCRFLNVNFDHQVARESWALYGITLTGNVGISTRTYR